MEFLDLFNDNFKNDNLIDLNKHDNVDRKRKLDTYMSSYIDEAESIAEKKPKCTPVFILNPLENIQHKVIVNKECKHEVFYPKCGTYKSLKPRRKDIAKEFPFNLDSFQSQTIQCIENNQNILVSAHTSAGKTVCASYAIALCLKEKRRVIYTTPIKALSNQKYREFKEEFEDVGLLTGDVTIDVNASVLVMTTEILLLMIYRSSEVIKEVGWVIYDEIHYMRDKHRGIIWEQSIILMLPEIRMLFLSATIPNSAEFGQWLAYIRSQPCNVVHTNFRPTPLQHYIYPNGADKIYQVVNDNGEFLENNFNDAISVLEKMGDNARSDMRKIGRKGGSTGLSTHCEKLIKKVFELKNDPAIVFSFSKQSCETYGKFFGTLNYSKDSQFKNSIELVFANALKTLPEEDRKLPQLDSLLKLMKRGIGIHHSGSLPVLKEVVEILFGEGLLKCLFATETFSMGLNMPAKTVVFTDAFKFDGESKRLLKSGEYIQMAGRAGRRGLDSHGNVILMLDRTIKSKEVKQIIMGDAEPLNSSFHLTFNMILNMIRSGNVTPEFLMEKSFLQFQAFTKLPDLKQDLVNKQLSLSEVVIEEEDMKIIRSYIRLQNSISSINENIWSLMRNENKYRSFIIPGRLVHIKCNESDFGWCIVMSKMGNSKTTAFAECLIPVNKDTILVKDLSIANPPPKYDLEPDAIILNVNLEYFFELSSVVVQKAEEMSLSLRKNDVLRKGYLHKRNDVFEKFNRIPLLDPKNDLGCNSKFSAELSKFDKELQILEMERSNHVLHADPSCISKINRYHKKIDLEESVEKLISEINKNASILNQDDLKSRKRILRRLNYISDSDVLTTKGRVACEISTGDVLMLTETLLSGSLSNLSEEQLLGFLSCFVLEESIKHVTEPQEDLSLHIDNMKKMARYISEISKECHINLYQDHESYVNSFKVGLVEIVRLWANGSSFGKLNDNSIIFDGTIVRCVRRLDELLGQLMEASKVIGNTDLEIKFKKASNLIKRGIIFSSSLYLAEIL